MKRLQISQKLVYEVAVVKKIYVHEIAAVNLSKIQKTYTKLNLENAKKTCKPNNRYLNRD